MSEVVESSAQEVRLGDEKEEEKLRAQQTEQQGELKFKTVFENANDCMFVLDVSGRILDVNKKAMDIFGRTKEELYGKHFSRVNGVSPKDVPRLVSGLAEVFAGKKSFLMLNVRSKAGRVIALECSGSLMKMGDKPSVLVIARDISERQRMEEALKESEERHRSLFELAPDGILTSDLKGNVTSVNEAFLRITGFSKEEIVGKHFTKLPTIREMDMNKYMRLFFSFLRGKKVGPVEFTYRRKDGTLAWGDAHPAVLKEKGKVVGFQVILRDITERRKAEESLRFLKEFNERVINSLSDVLLVIDSNNYRIIDANETASKQLKLRKEELIGKTCYEATHHTSTPCKPPHDICPIQEVIKTGKAVAVEHTHFDKDNNEVYVEVSISPVRNQQGKIIQVVHLARDITQHKQMEKQIRSLARFPTENPQPVLRLSREGVILYANGACQRLLRDWKSEVRGLAPKYWRDLVTDTLMTQSNRSIDVESGEQIYSLSMVPVVDADEVNIYGTDITERKKAEEAVRVSEEKYRELTESINDIFFAMDKELKYTYWNKASEKFTGISAKDAIGKSLTQIFPNVKGTKIEQLYLETLRTQQLHNFVNEFRHGDATFFFEINAYPTRDGLSVIAKDITEPKKAEDELRKSESKYRTLLENVPQKIFLKDRNSVYVSCNENYARDLKIKSSEIVGKTDYEFYPKELAEKYRTDDKRIMESGKTEDIEEEYIQDGQRVYVHTVKTPVKDENGNVVGILGIFWDVTERKKTEDALQDAKMKWVSLTENTDDVIIVTDSKGVIQYINRTTPPYTPEETIGKTLYDYVPREQHNVMEKSLREVFKTGKPDKYEVSSNIPKIGTMWFSTKVVPIQQDGKVTGAILISSDITERKRMEDELKRYSEHLEALVEERTRKLKEAQGQLLKAERLAAIGELATMVGHDLRNPLQSIENATFYLNNELTNLSASVPLSQKTTEMLQVINDSINYADKIIKDLQDFSATKPPKLDNTDINAIVKETLSQVQVPKNVELSTELDYLPEMMADKDQITRVFLNLTTNAIQAMENGGTLTISTKKTNGFVEISFKDTGIGISKENMEKIFTPFFTTRAKGMGMGLPICKKFIESHSGSIEVESEVGKGTTFTVKLPIQQGNGGEKQ